MYIPAAEQRSRADAAEPSGLAAEQTQQNQVAQRSRIVPQTPQSRAAEQRSSEAATQLSGEAAQRAQSPLLACAAHERCSAESVSAEPVSVCAEPESAWAELARAHIESQYACACTSAASCAPREAGVPPSAAAAVTLAEELRASKTEKYLGITLIVRATSRAQLDSLYSALTGHPMVKVAL